MGGKPSTLSLAPSLSLLLPILRPCIVQPVPSHLTPISPFHPPNPWGDPALPTSAS